MDDRTIVARQLGRSPRAFRRVAARCPFGLPAVTEQDPYDAHGEPFPTTYYVTCPHLVAASGLRQHDAVGPSGDHRLEIGQGERGRERIDPHIGTPARRPAAEEIAGRRARGLLAPRRHRVLEVEQ